MLCHAVHCPTSLHLQRFFSATLQNFATQSLLMAIGVGARKALAASAAINWMLKDGMNRLVRMGVATQFGDSFDSDLKVGGAGLTLLEGVSVSAFDPVAVTNDWPAVALLLLMMCWPAHNTVRQQYTCQSSFDSSRLETHTSTFCRHACAHAACVHAWMQAVRLCVVLAAVVAL